MAGKGSKDTRTTSFDKRRKNFAEIKGLNTFVPDWMKNDNKHKKTINKQKNRKKIEKS